MNTLVRHIFLALTSSEVEDLKKFAINKSFKGKNDFTIEKFRDCLSKYHMDEYTEPLYYYMILAKKRNIDYERRGPVYLSNKKYELTYKENLVNLIKILISENSIKSILVKCRKSIKPNRVQIINDDDINIIANTAIFPIWEKIEQLELNRICLTREEAIAAINNHSDVEWIKNWMVAVGHLDPNYSSFTLEKFEDYYRALGWKQIIHNYHEQLMEDFIDEYISDHKIELSLNPNTIERILDLIKEEKSRRGRKEDTFFLKSTAFELSVLKHAERYLGKKDVESIHDIPMIDDDHDFIHDVLVFFKLGNYIQNKPNYCNLFKFSQFVRCVIVAVVIIFRECEEFCVNYL